MAKASKALTKNANKPSDLLQICKERFEANLIRHPNLSWDQIVSCLEKNPKKKKALAWMEETGGEPDVILMQGIAQSICFVDCSLETPVGRKSLCYDDEALHSRKENKPKGSAKGMIKSLDLHLLSEVEYRHLQTIGSFDTKTSSWIETPLAIRTLGGALFCDRRYNTVFSYHNGAESYYAVRGFRTLLKLSES